ncbi:condensin complex non-SMC subunit Cnd1 [Sorochytrium milnesiophthora]
MATAAALTTELEPFSLQEELSRLQDKEEYYISNSFSVAACSPKDLQRKIDGPIRLWEITDSLAVSPINIADPLIFDAIRTLLKYTSRTLHAGAAELTDTRGGRSYAEIRSSDALSLADIILSGLYRMADVLERDLEDGDHDKLVASRQCLEMYMFLLHWFTLEAETKAASIAHDEKIAAMSKPKSKGRGKKDAPGAGDDFNWDEQKSRALKVMVKVLKLKLQKLWQSNSEQDTFFGLFTKPLHEMLRNGEKTVLRNAEMKRTLFQVLRMCVVNYGQLRSTITSIEQNLQYFDEFLAEPMADLVYELIAEDGYDALAENLLHSIGTRDIVDMKHAKTFGAFLCRLSELAPKEVLKQMIYLQKHIDCEVYQMRTAIIEVLGNIILKHLMEDDAPASKKRAESFIEDMLLERFRDRHVQCRKKVMQVFFDLVGHRYFYISYNSYWKRVVHLVVGRLQDKTQPVRSQAIKTLKEILLRHPFSLHDGGFLDEDTIRSKLAVTNKELKALIESAPDLLVESKHMDLSTPAKGRSLKTENGEDDFTSATPAAKKEVKEEEDDDDDDDKSVVMVGSDEEMDIKPIIANGSQPVDGAFDVLDVSPQEVTSDVMQAQEQFNRDYTRLVHHQKYYMDALEFVEQLNLATEVLSQLLASKSKSEVIDAMDFFVSAHRYKTQSSKAGIRQMMHLIWTKDTSSSDEKVERSVKRHLIECFKDIYLTPVDVSVAQDQVNVVVRNLIMLTYDTTLADLTSLEQVVSTVMAAGQIPDSVVQKLWLIYSSKSTNIPRKQRRGAILVLGWLAHTKMEVVGDHIESLLSVGCGALGKDDLVLAKYTCLALQRLAPVARGKAEMLQQNRISYTRLPEDHDIFACLKPLILDTATSSEWFGLAEQVLNTIYALAENPDIICTSIIQTLAVSALKLRPDGAPAVIPDASALLDPQQSMLAQGMRETQLMGEQQEYFQDAASLSRLFFVLGHVAIKHIVHLEVIEDEYKRRRANMFDYPTDKKSTDDKKSAEQLEDELENIVGTVEDEFSDNIALIRERELLFGPKSLLAAFTGVISHVCANNKFYKSRMLQTTAVLALCKFMCVSAEFCEKHLPLLFNILAKSTEPIIRSNAIIALGDMTVRFSTLIDQNISFLYDRLSDSDPIVRKNALMVLSHLVLNGMVKVKGQLSSMALCVESEEPRIANLAKLFFEELASKDNAIYNNMPDIISNLTSSERPIDEELFQKVMKYLFGFITKWRDIAYCLTLLPYAPEKVETGDGAPAQPVVGANRTERNIKKLIDGVVHYQDKLYEDDVYKSLMEIVSKASARAGKQETKALIEEFAAKLGDLRTRCVADHRTAMEAERANRARAAKALAGRQAHGDQEQVDAAADALAQLQLGSEERTTTAPTSATPRSRSTNAFGGAIGGHSRSHGAIANAQTPQVRAPIGFADSARALREGGQAFSTPASLNLTRQAGGLTSTAGGSLSPSDAYVEHDKGSANEEAEEDDFLDETPVKATARATGSRTARTAKPAAKPKGKAPAATRGPSRRTAKGKVKAEAAASSSSEETSDRAIREKTVASRRNATRAARKVIVTSEEDEDSDE